MGNYTHNGGPIVIDVHPDDRMKYAPWNLRDFLQGVRGLKPDQIGLYAIILNLLYDTMGQLKDDEGFISGHCKCEVRYYRKLRQSLIDAGKIYEADGYLYNNRAMAEIAKFCETARKKREAALAREAQKREARTSGARDARLSGAYGARDAHGSGTQQDDIHNLTGKNFSENLNQINGSTTTAVVTAVPEDRVYKEREREIEKKVPPIPPLQGGGHPVESELFDLIADEPPDDTVDEIAEQFEVWWQHYPNSVRKVAKGECKALFREAITGRRRPNAKRVSAKILDYGKATAEQLIAAVRAYAATKPDPEYTPAPATWLNQGRWLDGPQPGQPSTADANQPWWKNPDKVAAMTPDRWRNGIQQFANGRWDTGKLGPPPGSPKCLVPREIVAEMRLTEIYTDAGIKRVAQ